MTQVKFSKRPFEGTINNLVSNFFTELPVLFKNDFNFSESKGIVPVNVKETENSFQLEVVAPGFEKSDFKVNVDQNLLTISAENKDELKIDNEKLIRREYSFHSFKRTFTLDEKIDATKTEATYINGILTLNLPKKETVKASAKEIVIN